MLKPAKMQKIRLVSIKSVARPLLAELHHLGMLELRRFESTDFESGKTMDIHDRISSSLVRLRSIKSMLGLMSRKPQCAEMELDRTLEEAESFQIEEGLQEKHRMLESNSTEIANLQSRSDDAKKLYPFQFDFSKLQSDHLSFAAGTVVAARLPALRKELAGTQMQTAVSGSEGVVVLAYPSDDAKAELVLSKLGFAPIDTEGFTTPRETAKEFQSRISALRAENDKIKAEISEMAKKYGDKVLRLTDALGLWSERAIATKEMGFGSQTMIIEGWIKDSDFESFRNTLEAKFGTKVFVEKIKNGKEEPPVVLDNPQSTGPMEFLVRLVSLPKPSEIDPTIVLFFTVPLIYGMILGDVIYGIISFFIAGWLMKKWKKGGFGYGVASVWRFSAAAGIIFGLIFDEWFGMSSYQLLEVFQMWGFINLASLGIDGPLYAGFHRGANVSLLIGMSILLGLVHLALGFLMGAINEWNHNRKHAIGKLAWIFIELGGFLAVSTAMFGVFPPIFVEVGLGMFILSAVIMAVTEGPIGLMEIPGLLGNILSYARIAAVGLVGVLLAELINHSFVPTPDQGIVMAFIMLPVLILFHVMNIGLAMVECVVQGGRLNLVEFYGKFFHGGGKEFTPFAITAKQEK
ncbi:hypothetical protein GF412_04235 [Candidatus Micrarchaeota archaeon]|nr:hypothetical protein [Candidatus Micrarchaeota archaeon]MBD3418159.1 hypothetical protein [Candidatus Micrarchaeota archaeon]